MCGSCDATHFAPNVSQREIEAARQAEIEMEQKMERRRLALKQQDGDRRKAEQEARV